MGDKIIIRNKIGPTKMVCNGCNKAKRPRHIIKYKGEYLCTSCMSKLPSARETRSIEGLLRGNTGRPTTKLDKALNKIYTVRSYMKKDGVGINCSIGLPSVFAGKKVKISIVEEK